MPVASPRYLLGRFAELHEAAGADSAMDQPPGRRMLIVVGAEGFTR
jgi:hypothetical protein